MSSRDTEHPVIVVGYDGTERGDDAAALGAAIARRLDGRVVIAGVYHQDFPQWPGSDEFEASMRQIVAEQLRKVDVEGLGVPAEVRTVRARSEARGLHELAENLDAELIVVGSTHRSAVGRVLVGSTGQRLLQESPCGVVVAPHGYSSTAQSDAGRIAVGYDGTLESEAALSLATRLATRSHATLNVIGVVEPHTYNYADAMSGVMVAAEAVGAERRRMEHVMKELPDRLPTPQPVETVVVEGRPVQELVDASRDADMIVLGSRSYGPIGRALAGSVSSGVALRSHCPVVIVPRQVAERREAEHARELAGREA